MIKNEFKLWAAPFNVQLEKDPNCQVSVWPCQYFSLNVSQCQNKKSSLAQWKDTLWKPPVPAFYGLAFNRTFLRIYLRANYSRWWALPCDLKEVPRKMGRGGVWWGILHRSQTALKVVQCCTLDRLQRLMSTVWNSPRAPSHPLILGNWQEIHLSTSRTVIMTSALFSFAPLVFFTRPLCQASLKFSLFSTAGALVVVRGRNTNHPFHPIQIASL